MLYNVLTVLLCDVLGVLCVGCYRMGLRDGMRAKDGAPPAPIRRESARVKADNSRYDAILKNIDAYNGTSAGQKKVNK